MMFFDSILTIHPTKPILYTDLKFRGDDYLFQPKKNRENRKDKTP